MRNRGSRLDPISEYRSAQQALRVLFQPFTAEHCPTCRTPCCRKPARIQPLDLILLETLISPNPVPPGAVERAAGEWLESAAAAADPDLGPCEFLTGTGCRFPGDLRPLGCTAFICQPMRSRLSAESLDALIVGVGRVEAAHVRLAESLGLGGGAESA